MELKNKLGLLKNLTIINECVIDYVGPLFIFGNIDLLLNKNEVTVASACLPKEEFAIINSNIPSWVKQIEAKSNESNNILVITDMDKISLENQDLFLDLIENKQISTYELPENLKIILHASKKCEINPKLRVFVESYEI